MSNLAAPSAAALPLRWRGFRPAELLALLFFSVVMALPILFLLVGSFNTAPPGQPSAYGVGNWVRAFSDPQTMSALWMSFLFSVVRLIPSLTLSVLVAWLIARTDMPGGHTIEVLCWFAFFVPDFPLTLAWILLLDPQFGFLNTLATALPFVSGPLFNPYSFWGIVWVHLGTGGIWFNVMLLTPLFRRLGATLEEAARVAGANTFTTLWRVTFPVLSPMILAIAVLSFIKGLESFNTELLLGLPAGIYVYGTRIFDYLRQEPPAYGEATALGSVFLLVLAVLAFVYRRYFEGNKKFTVVTGQGYSTLRVKLGNWRYVALGGFILWFVVMMVLPLTFLVIGSFMRRYGFFNISSPFTLAHWQNLLNDPIFLGSLQNSLIIASATALMGVLLYSSVGYLLASPKPLRTRTALEFFCWLPWVIPGILMSLGLLWIFLATPLRTVLYGTVWGIALALTIQDSPVSTQAFKSAFLQLGPDLEEAARVAGAPWRYTYMRILLPLVAPVAVTVAMLNFGSALTSISTPVLLYSAQSRPLSILLLEYSYTGELERAAALGLLITAIICVMMLVGRRFGLKMSNPERIAAPKAADGETQKR
ncbi:MAG: iron ABC transporter permease [Burkholderiales bacterium]|nr:iron ABC transporter permease [Burkholderiales bacterium]